MTKKAETIDWLLDSDPAIRWQVMRDLVSESDDVIKSERSRVVREGWGADLLALQDADGTWDGGTYRPGWVDDAKPFFDAWTATHFSLQLLTLLGVDPESTGAAQAVELVRDNVRWHEGDPYFDGETEECINGIALRSGAYFGHDVDKIVDRLLSDQLGDGGWNCWSDYGATVGSFHPTICVLEGLLEWERAGGASDEVTAARQRGKEYLLERRLFRRKSTGDVIDPRYTMLSFPHYWYYDVLRALDYFRASAEQIDDRAAEAVELVSSKRRDDGRWPLENRHQGPTHFRMDGPEGDPSRWITVRAMRVLAWAGAS
jgi:hypothetical protein